MADMNRNSASGDGGAKVRDRGTGNSNIEQDCGAGGCGERSPGVDRKSDRGESGSGREKDRGTDSGSMEKDCGAGGCGERGPGADINVRKKDCCEAGGSRAEKDCCACSERHKERSPEEYRDLINRLSRIEGQVRGIKAMVERGAYCPDILVQTSAVNSALNSFSKVLLSSHIRTCVRNDIREGNDEVVEELVATLQKMMK